MSRILAAAAASLAPPAFAHPGHAVQAASHWHATDVLGFLLVGVVAAAAVAWARNRGK